MSAARPRWYWTRQGMDGLGRGLHVLALLPAAKSRRELTEALKSNDGRRIEGLDLRKVLFRRFLTALSLDGLLGEIDTWAWYPSHDGTPKHRLVSDYLRQVSRLVRDAHAPGLLVRHLAAPKSATARRQGHPVCFSTQVRTVHLDRTYRAQVEGKHVLVVDDFCTEGYSFEWARNLLYAGAARAVTCACFGRYHDEYTVQTPKPGRTIDPWAPCPLRDADFHRTTVRGVIDERAMVASTRLRNCLLALSQSPL